MGVVMGVVMGGVMGVVMGVVMGTFTCVYVYACFSLCACAMSDVCMTGVVFHFIILGCMKIQDLITIFVTCSYKLHCTVYVL